MEENDKLVFEVKDVNLFYGEKHVLHNVNINILKN